MRTKQQEFLELLNTFIGEYMPLTAGLRDNTVRLYKAAFRLLLTFLFETFDCGEEDSRKENCKRTQGVLYQR